MASRCHNFTRYLILLTGSLVIIFRCSYADDILHDDAVVDNELKQYVDKVLSVDEFPIIPGVKVQKLTNVNESVGVQCDGSRAEARGSSSVEKYVDDKLDRYAKSHSLVVDFKETGRVFFPSGIYNKTDSGKSSFLAGFGMGFLAFALKKLLLPVFIGAQLVKSVLIAMFLPSILGGLGKIVGKGLSTFSGLSGASTGINHATPEPMEDFEFKDTDPYANEQGVGNDFRDVEATNQLATLEASTGAPSNSRLGFAHQRVSFVPNQLNDNYYLRRPNKKTDYKVFHKIPSSSMLLTSYDPFYSPLLSRLDAVFQQLGLGDGKSKEVERCRERLVCLMYANPAKYAPYSNLVSAQLSRELNELRKPSSDNPDILRFFRYMKAAKDGQDGGQCSTYVGCPTLTENKPSPAMLTTFNDINKLVLARKLK
nr:unnamed protein product [Callosobruchus analis]